MDDSVTDDRNGFEDLELSEWRGMNRLQCGNYTSSTDFYRANDGRYLCVDLRQDPRESGGEQWFEAGEMQSEDASVARVVSARYLRESCTPISAEDLPWHPWHEDSFT